MTGNRQSKNATIINNEEMAEEFLNKNLNGNRIIVRICTADRSKIYFHFDKICGMHKKYQK